VSALGVIYNIFKSIVDCFQLKFWKGIASFFVYWARFIYQLWNVAKYCFLHMAIAFDLFGNVAGGEMIEDCVTAKEKTLYGHGDITVSGATGKLEIDGDLNKTGKWFTWMLSRVLGQGHSVNAYLSEIKKD
jgi:hypothetical protein